MVIVLYISDPDILYLYKISIVAREPGKKKDRTIEKKIQGSKKQRQWRREREREREKDSTIRVDQNSQKGVGDIDSTASKVTLSNQRKYKSTSPKK